MAVVEISVTPLGTGESGVSKFVAGCVKVVREAGLAYQLTPMGTIIEGDIGEILPVLQRMHETPFAAGATRVSTLIKIDDRRDAGGHSMAGKVRAVEQQL